MGESVLYQVCPKTELEVYDGMLALPGTGVEIAMHQAGKH